MELKKITANNLPYTALLYCKTGGGKSTAIGIIAEASEGNTLVLDVDRTITRTLAKGEIVKDTSKIFVQEKAAPFEDEHPLSVPIIMTATSKYVNIFFM